MIKSGTTFRYDMDHADEMGHIIYAQACDFNRESDSVERMGCESPLEYIFQLIRSAFLYIEANETYLPPRKIDDVDVHLLAFPILSLPFQDETNNTEVEQWNDLVTQVTEDFINRKDAALRQKCTYLQLEELIRNWLEEFDYPDRERLNEEKLVNLTAFVYDYCCLTMKEARLYHNLDQYVDGTIVIREQKYTAPLRICSAVHQYCKDGGQIDDIMRIYYGPDFDLPIVQLKPVVQNPHANDSYISAMFVDLMHKFFLSFGLKKFGKSDWAKAERWLIYELLRIFGLCKSSKPAKESKYVTTVMNDYGDYFTKCNLRTWIREDQAYSYLMSCSQKELTSKGQYINEPFILLSDYSVVKETAPKADEPSEYTEIEDKDLPKEFQELIGELSGNEYKVTQNVAHKLYGQIGYMSAKPKEGEDDEQVTWDPRLDYVMDLIDSSFECITFIPQISQYLITRQDLHNPGTRRRLVAALERDLISRLEAIPRGRFNQEDAMKCIRFFFKCCSSEDRQKLDENKLYVLFLFIFDYVYLTYKESIVNRHLRHFIRTRITVCGEPCLSTIFCDDLLSTYLQRAFVFVRGEKDTDVFEQIKGRELDDPIVITPIAHPSCNVKNMTAMFFDLFARFFKGFGLTKRSSVRYASDLECSIIGDLASCCGICSSNAPGTARSMYMTNKEYFKNSSLYVSIRDNEYRYLMLNNMSEELFGSKTDAEDKDS